MANPSLKQGDPIPEDLGAVVDAYRDVREIRLLMQKEVEAVEARERELREHILANLSKSTHTTGVAGRRFRAQRVEKVVPAADDWTKIHAYVQETGRFDLLQKRLSDKAVSDAWDEGDEIPGVERFIKVDLSVTKI